MKQVILIMVDTQRQDMLSCYESRSPKTVALDKLASEGTVFDNAFTCQPVCGPARSAIFTGLYPHSNGMVSNCMQLGEKVKNAGQWLSPHNIECGYIGKWHLDGGDYFGYGKCPSGYNQKYWYDMRNFLDELPTDEARKLSRKHMGLRTDAPDEKDTYAHRATDRAIAFVNEFKDKDYFLTLSLDEPHDPSVCPRRFFKLLKSGKYMIKSPNAKASLKYKPEHQKVYSRQFKKIPYYAARIGNKSLHACNLFCDYEIGRLLDEVEKLGAKPLIIYTADHGDMLMSHNLMGKGCVMYNEIVKVPLIIKGKDFKVGIDKTTVSHIDLLPTIMDYFGVKIPAMLQGEPLSRVLGMPNRNVFIEFTRYEVDHDGFMGFQPIRCVCNGDYKLVINLLSSDELYDLNNDPYEKNNLIESPQHCTIRNKLHDDIIEQMNVTRDLYRGYYWYTRPWRKGAKPSFNFTGYTRQLVEEDFVQLDYNTGLPMSSGTRKK